MDNSINKGFPSHLVDPSQKNKAWISQYIKAAWNDFNTSYPSSLYNGRDKYHETKLYMLGKQPISRYRTLLGDDTTANGDSSWVNINWDILPIIPKFRRIAIETLLKTEYNISIDAIDPVAQDDKNNFYAENAAKIKVREELAKNGLDPDLVPQPDIDVANLQELDMYMNYSYKHRLAVEMEQAIKLILNNNRFESERALIIEDLHDNGIAAYKDSIDSNGNIKVRRVNVSNLIHSYSNSPTLDDIQYAGEVLELTISDLKEMAGDSLTPQQYEMIAEKYTGRLNNPASIREDQSNSLRNIDGFRILVLDLEFLSINSLILEERVNSKGNPVVGRTSKIKDNRKDKKYSKTDYKAVYTGKWVIDSDIFFDCKLQTNMKRAISSMSETRLSYHIVAPNIYQSGSYSLGSQTITIADNIQLAWYKLQNVMLRARPRGISIEIGALEDIPIGKAGKQMKPLDIIDLYNQTGNLIYRRTADTGDSSNYRPIDELNNGIGNEALEYFGIINNNMQLLRDILGFNEITDGSTPDPRTLKGVAKLASESTNNSLGYIRRAERDLLERLCYDLTLRIQDVAKTGYISGYIRALGSSTVQFFKLDPDVSAYECGLIITQKPNEAEREKLARRIEQAIEINQITLADAMMIENLDNMKYAEILLAYKIKQNKEEAQKLSMEQQQMNANIQAQAAQIAEEEKRKTLQLEADLKLQLLSAEKELDSQITAMKLRAEAEIEAGKITGKMDIAKIESDSRESVARIKNSKDKLLGNEK